MTALVTAATMASHVISSNETSAAPSALVAANGQNKKATRQRVTTSRTARNMYAFVYTKEHPAATTHEFDAAFKNLSDEIVQQFNAMHEFAVTRPSNEPLETIIEAFNSLDNTERKKFNDAVKSTKGKQVAKTARNKGRIPAHETKREEGGVKNM
ncbi:hypothetical protein NUW54_g8214 [Trametes sanguinea]|nr:hypothetical protein NUW54_g8214 [Trametes sanguinea]